MAIGRESRIWVREVVPPIHGPARTIPVTAALVLRFNRLLREWRRFRMPTWAEEKRLDAMTREQVTRSVTVSNGAYLGQAQTGREWT
jgi:hypothetical protein